MFGLERVATGAWERILDADQVMAYGDLTKPGREQEVRARLSAAGNTPQEIDQEINPLKARYPQTLISSLEFGQKIDYLVGTAGIGLLAAAMRQRNLVGRGLLAVSGAIALEFASQDYGDRAAKIRAVKRYISHKAA